MLDTFAALFFAHVAADFVAQTRSLVDNKDRPAPMALHIAIVAFFSAFAVGLDLDSRTFWLALGLLTVSHGAMDLAKTHLLPPDRLWPYLLDQMVHIATIVALSFAFPGLSGAGLWAELAPELFPVLTSVFLVAGFGIFAVAGGDHGVRLLLGQLEAGRAENGPEAVVGAPLAGKRIGQLERGLVFLLMLIGQAQGVAFLIAAKSILRFGTVQKDRAASEYVIVGTLASVGWAMVTAAILLALLPPEHLEALRANP
jgi:hypothetical protein